jgi:uncharacterized protein YjeT (DUF2065 family)
MKPQDGSLKRFPKDKITRLTTFAGAVVAWAALCSPASADTVTTVFEGFNAGNGSILAAFNPSATQLNAFRSAGIGTIAAGGGQVYWTEGVNLWSGNDTLGNAQLLHVNGLAPNSLAYDASTGALFEGFNAGNGSILAAFNSTASQLNAFRSAGIGAVAAGGGHVYWTEGVDLWTANDDLTNAQLLHVNGLAPDSLAYDASTGVLFEGFKAGNGSILAAFNSTASQLNAFRSAGIGAVAAAGGQVYWTEGVNLWSANDDLTNPQLLHVNGLSPDSLAVDFSTPSVGAVPEASTWAMMMLGFLGLGCASFRRSRRRMPATA